MQPRRLKTSYIHIRPGEPNGQGNGWQYNAAVVTPGPAYGGAAWNQGGGSLAHAITFGDAKPLGGGTAPKAIESAGPKMIAGEVIGDAL